jgi:lipoate-protein ligase A
VVGRGSFCVGFAEAAPTFEGTRERYERLTAALIAALAAAGVEAERGELDGEWCPGTWSLRSHGVKLAGLAQRAIKGAAWADAVVELAPDEPSRALLAEARCRSSRVATSGSTSWRGRCLPRSPRPEAGAISDSRSVRLDGGGRHR